MTGALVILAALVVIGTLLFLTDITYFRHHHNSEAQTSLRNNKEAENSGKRKEVPDEVCCGQHLVCEKSSLAITSDDIIYYDDEELDRFAGREPESYTPEETEEFRDILMTLIESDVPGWAKSISLRNIQLPLEVRDELLLIVTEMRKPISES